METTSKKDKTGCIILILEAYQVRVVSVQQSIQYFSIHSSPWATPWALDILNFHLIQFPTPRSKLVVKCSHPKPGKTLRPF